MLTLGASLLCSQLQSRAADAKSSDAETVKAEHALIGVSTTKSTAHSQHPDAQWYPDAGLGKPTRVSLIRDGSELKYVYSDRTLTVELPAAKRSKLVDVVKVEM